MRKRAILLFMRKRAIPEFSLTMEKAVKHQLYDVRMRADQLHQSWFTKKVCPFSWRQLTGWFGKKWRKFILSSGQLRILSWFPLQHTYGHTRTTHTQTQTHVHARTHTQVNNKIIHAHAHANTRIKKCTPVHTYTMMRTIQPCSHSARVLLSQGSTLYLSATVKGEVRTINARNICGRRSCMKNNGESPTFKFVSGEERRPSKVQRVSRSWRLPGATHLSADLIWIRKWLEIQAPELSELESVKLELGNCCFDFDK